MSNHEDVSNGAEVRYSVRQAVVSKIAFEEALRTWITSGEVAAQTLSPSERDCLLRFMVQIGFRHRLARHPLWLQFIGEPQPNDPFRSHREIFLEWTLRSFERGEISAQALRAHPESFKSSFKDLLISSGHALALRHLQEWREFFGTQSPPRDDFTLQEILQLCESFLRIPREWLDKQGGISKDPRHSYGGVSKDLRRSIAARLHMSPEAEFQRAEALISRGCETPFLHFLLLDGAQDVPAVRLVAPIVAKVLVTLRAEGERYQSAMQILAKSHPDAATHVIPAFDSVDIENLLNINPSLAGGLATANLNPKLLSFLVRKAPGIRALSEQAIAKELDKAERAGKLDEQVTQVAALWRMEREANFCLLRAKLNGEPLYRVKRIPKRNGSFRELNEPCPWLKASQRRLNLLFMKQLDGQLHECATGFRPRRSIADNARQHVGSAWIVNIDVKDFFPSVRSPMVEHAITTLLEDALHYPKERAQWLATQLTRRCLTYRGRLPAGAPTSPFIGNLVLKPIDEEIAKWCKSQGLRYTRYADDLTVSLPVSATHQGRVDVEQFVTALLAQAGFAVAAHKTTFRRKNQRQLVTGLVTNERVSVPKRQRKLLRAMLHHEATGKPVIAPGVGPISDASLRGFESYKKMVDRAARARRREG